jgi:hypothetical protein
VARGGGGIAGGGVGGGGDGSYTIFRVLVMCRANDGILQQQTGSGITLLVLLLHLYGVQEFV